MASLEHTTRLLKEKTNQMEIDRIKRQELEEALLHSQKMKAVGQLTGGLAHDFNNLLAVIIGSLELVEPDARDAPRLSRALKAAERGALLTQRLLAFSRKQALHQDCLFFESEIHHEPEPNTTLALNVNQERLCSYPA